MRLISRNCLLHFRAPAPAGAARAPRPHNCPSGGTGLPPRSRTPPAPLQPAQTR